LGTRFDRWVKLEEKAAEQQIKLTDEQNTFTEKQNPPSRRRTQSRTSREPLNWGNFSWAMRRDGQILPARAMMIDAYSSYALGFLRVTKQPEAAVTVAHTEALSFYVGFHSDAFCYRGYPDATRYCTPHPRG
jgi:hypothetical protein